jgi:hypothetical protein
MRTHSDELEAVLLTGSFSTRLIVDAFAGPDRTITDLGAAGWDLRWDREGDLKSAGTLAVVHMTDEGTTVVPSEVTDPLAPFGQEVNILMEISAGDFSETVQIGYYRLGAGDGASDEYADVGDRRVVTSSSLRLQLEDRLSAVKRRGFRSEENPASTSGWDELARITGLQVVRSLADITLSEEFVYAAVKGGRLAAVRTIAFLIGGTEYTTPDGALSVLPATPGDVVGRLVLGEDGTIDGEDLGMDSSEVFNVVVGDFETVDRIPIHVVSEATGDLAPGGLYSENTYYHSNSAITTEAAAEIEVAAVLAQMSETKARRITVQCVLNPLVELGDVLEVERRDGSLLTAQVVKYRYGTSSLMTLEMDVIDSGLE